MKILSILLVAGLLLSCDQGQVTAVAQATEGIPNPLIVVTRNAPTTWFEGSEGPAGMEHDLVLSFAQSQNVEVSFEIKDSIAEVLESRTATPGS